MTAIFRTMHGNLARRRLSRCLAAASVVGLVAMSLPIRDAGAFDQSANSRPAQIETSTLPGIEILPRTNEHGAGFELTVPGGLGTSAKTGKAGSLPGWSFLPKLDFGLELLYGAPNQGAPTPDQLDALPDALTVHGEIKKQF